MSHTIRIDVVNLLCNNKIVGKYIPIRNVSLVFDWIRRAKRFQLMNKSRRQVVAFWKSRSANREQTGLALNFPKRPSFISTYISFCELMACMTVSLSSNDPICTREKRITQL